MGIDFVAPDDTVDESGVAFELQATASTA